MNKQTMQDLMICAFEGGSNYWYQIESNTHGSYLNALFGKGLQISNALIGGDDEPRSHWLNIEMMKDGAKIMQDKYPRHYKNAMNDNADADTGDVFLQCALFGEVIYG